MTATDRYWRPTFELIKLDIETGNYQILLTYENAEQSWDADWMEMWQKVSVFGDCFQCSQNFQNVTLQPWAQLGAPHFFQTVGINYAMTTTFFSLGFVIYLFTPQAVPLTF